MLLKCRERRLGLATSLGEEVVLAAQVGRVKRAMVSASCYKL